MTNKTFFFEITECDNFFKQSLFIVGEIGGNDVFLHISKAITELREIVPLIVESITKTTNVGYIRFE